MAEDDFDLDETPPPSGHNKPPKDDAYNVAADELRQVIEQYEHLEADKKDISEQQKDVMSEARARGYDTKAMKKIIALRKRDKNDIAEQGAIMSIYANALGMDEILAGL